MTTEKQLIFTSPNDCIKKTTRKTNFAKIIVSGTAEEPYYSIMWFNYMDNQYHVGYGSYNLHFVFQWLSECFEIKDAPVAEAVPVVRGRWIHDYNNLYGCSECGGRETMSPKKLKNYCPNCGALMDGKDNVPRTDGDGNG